MCGIAGMICFDGREPAVEQLQRMTDIIHHRGPDDSGFWSEPGVGLGFRRLSIIDLAEGHQPMSNENERIWIIFNGEIYNYKALRNELEARGHQFKTQTDTEVIVHLYEEYGEDCVNHLRGMFGFAIWDMDRKRLFAARDHFGIKPLYYALSDDRLVFGSEIKSVLQGGVARKLNMEALLQYMTFQYVPEPNTMLEGVQKLPPGHSMTIELDGKLRIQRYWDPTFEPASGSLDSMIEELRERLLDSVRHHMQSDVERGCFLSSGIDSTAIAAYMRSIEPIKTFSVGFEGPNNETEIARETAKALGTEHYAKVISPGEYLDTLERAVWHQDEPVADPSAIALYHVAALAREHVTVVLSGEGADELFGGYRIYREPLALRPFAWMPVPLLRMMNRMASRLPASVYGRNYLLRATTPLEERFLGNARIFREDMKAELVAAGKNWLDTYTNPLQVARPFYEQSSRLDPVSRMQYIDMNLWLPGDILMKADKMTMAHSLELRVPFLDKELFELARRIPASYRLQNGTTKYVFRKAMEGIVPDFILNRPKLGFPVPLRDWMKEPIGDRILETIRSRDMAEWFDIDAAERLMKAHRAGEGDYARHLWILYVFALWQQTYLQRDAIESPLGAAYAKA